MQSVYGGRRFIINSTTYSFNLLPNHFSQFFFYSSSSSSFSSSANDFVEYLVNSLGFSHENAVTTSTKLSRFRKVNYSNLSTNAVSVVNLFKNHGFNDSQIKKIVSTLPTLLTYRADETIKPKLGFLIDHGFSKSDLIRFVSGTPDILTRRVESLILPAIQELRQILDVNDALVALKNLPSGHFNYLIKNLSPNVALLTSYGVPIELIKKHLVMRPSMFSPHPVTFKDIMTRVEKKLGINPCSTMFLYGVYVFTICSEKSIESKCRVFKSFGWTQSDIEALMMMNVYCFGLSDENIKKKLDFLMNVLQLEPAFVVSRIAFLTCSLEKRILPRHDVMQILKAKGLLQRDVSFYSVVTMSESRFVNTFVLPYEEIHQVYAKHTGHAVTSTTQEKAENLQ